MRRSVIEMLDLADSKLVNAATVAVAMFVVHVFFASRRQKHRPKVDLVHVATQDEVQQLAATGSSANGTIVEIYNRFPGRPSGESSPPLVPDLTGLLIASVLHFLWLAARDRRRAMKQGAEIDAGPLPVKLDGDGHLADMHLLYEFEAEHLGRRRRFRGATAFDREPYYGIEMVGKRVKVRYLAQDPSISVIDSA